MTLFASEKLSPLKPYRAGASRQQIKMAHYGGSIVFVVQKLRQEHMDRGAKRVYRKVSKVFRKSEEREPNTERKMREGRLFAKKKKKTNGSV